MIKTNYDFIVVGAGAAGSVLAAELSASGAQVLVIESGGPDDAPTIANPSIWFYNVGGPLDYHLPVKPSPRLNNRTFNMALGHVLGGGSSINAMVWTRGMQRDYDGWAANGAKGWAFADVLPVFKAQEDWEGGANAWRGAGGPIHIRRPRDPHPTAPAFIDAAREMGMPILDDVNGPMRPRRRLHQHEHRRGWDSRERRSRLPAPSVVEAEPDAAAQHQRGETELQRHSLRGRQDQHRWRDEGHQGRQGSDPCRRRHRQSEASDALGRRGSEGTSQSWHRRRREPARRWRESAGPCARVRRRVQVQRQDAGSAGRQQCRRGRGVLVERSIGRYRHQSRASNNCPSSHPKPRRALEHLQPTRSRSRRLWCSHRAEAPSAWPATTFRMPR